MSSEIHCVRIWAIAEIWAIDGIWAIAEIWAIVGIWAIVLYLDWTIELSYCWIIESITAKFFLFTFLWPIANWRQHTKQVFIHNGLWKSEISEISEIWDNRKEQLSVSRTWESVRRAVPTDMQNQVTEVFNQVTSVTYFFVYKISKPFWVDCLQMRNDLPVNGLVTVMKERGRGRWV